MENLTEAIKKGSIMVIESKQDDLSTVSLTIPHPHETFTRIFSRQKTTIRRIIGEFNNDCLDRTKLKELCEKDYPHFEISQEMPYIRGDFMISISPSQMYLDNLEIRLRLTKPDLPLHIPHYDNLTPKRPELIYYESDFNNAWGGLMDAITLIQGLPNI
jgi:hypothetical protein